MYYIYIYIIYIYILYIYILYIYIVFYIYIYILYYIYIYIYIYIILLKQFRITYGLESTVINWFASYLSDRTQSVHLDSRFSARSTMRFGVPQGSVLGPLMFLLYTADIEKLIARPGLSPHLYADDTQMFICCRPGNTHLLRDTTLSFISNIEIGCVQTD